MHVIVSRSFGERSLSPKKLQNATTLSVHSNTSVFYTLRSSLLLQHHYHRRRCRPRGERSALGTRWRRMSFKRCRNTYDISLPRSEPVVWIPTCNPAYDFGVRALWPVHAHLSACVFFGKREIVITYSIRWNGPADNVYCYSTTAECSAQWAIVPSQERLPDKRASWSADPASLPMQRLLLAHGNARLGESRR